jgi:hypothetical protein
MLFPRSRRVVLLASCNPTRRCTTSGNCMRLAFTCVRDRRVHLATARSVPGAHSRLSYPKIARSEDSGRRSNRVLTSSGYMRWLGVLFQSRCCLRIKILAALYNRAITRTHSARGRSGLNALAMRNVYVMNVSKDMMCIQWVEASWRRRGS